MRAPVYRRGANPNIERPILKKKIAYLEREVADGNATWVDVDDPSRGIFLRTARTQDFNDQEKKIGGGTMTSAWALLQSGYAGPLVWQMPTTKTVTA